jgi:hypothetical protein
VVGNDDDRTGKRDIRAKGHVARDGQVIEFLCARKRENEENENSASLNGALSVRTRRDVPACRGCS